MKRVISVATIFVFAASQALAAAPTGTCYGTALTMSDMQTALNNNYAFYPGPEGWNERHNAGTGQICEFAQGSGHPVDPSKNIGTYTITDETYADPDTGMLIHVGLITYTYTGGGSYSFYVSPPLTAPTYQFCPKAGGMELAITVYSGPSCP